MGTFFCSLQLPTSSLVYQTSSCISITNRNNENVFNFVNNKFDFDTYAYNLLCELRSVSELILKNSHCITVFSHVDFPSYRRRLTICPILEGEDYLRLLNFQHNLICRISHLENLKRLIFLDFYDNQIEEISGLSALRSLRVLMLGKNRYCK